MLSGFFFTRTCSSFSGQHFPVDSLSCGTKSLSGNGRTTSRVHTSFLQQQPLFLHPVKGNTFSCKKSSFLYGTLQLSSYQCFFYSFTQSLILESFYESYFSTRNSFSCENEELTLFRDYPFLLCNFRKVRTYCKARVVHEV